MTYYIYYFNNADNKWLMAKGHLRLSNWSDTGSRVPLNIVDLDEGNINKKFIKVPVEEGKIYRRAFWLSSDDLNRALDIINDYEKAKWIEARERLQRIEKRS